MAEPEAAVAIVHAHEPISSFLLIRRTERQEDSWSGHWSFPGGRREADDPDLLHTALRELEEECGIRVSDEHNQAELSPVLARRKTGPFVLVAPFVFEVDQELPTVVNPEEAVEAVWVPLSIWYDPARHSLRNVPGLPGNRLFPAIGLNGVPVWGFTYRLVMDWLSLIDKQGPIEEAGFGMARRVLNFLVSLGLGVKRSWEERIAHTEFTERQLAKVAVVHGTIPVEPVVRYFSAPEELFPSVTLLEIWPDRIRVVGLALDEYLIMTEA